MNCVNCEWTENTPFDSTESSCESWRISASQESANLQEPENIHKSTLPIYSHASLNDGDTFCKMRH